MDELMTQGLELMLTGIGVVFAFLITLVVLMTLMSALLTRFLPEPAPVPAPADAGNTDPSAATGGAQPVSPHVLAIIQDAVRQHRARRA
ncbi:OadG family protein [Alcanivorax sp. JB21]|uniref:OadG family protein n=1 Tax=Alcanivorax limicola TaxID=2874102 RepID=UPI001CBDCD2B|nr:OadG family transporter subunit [Alcanivorax limicola]MBZ2189968.1 OadG family protein [Alcanivorax limicola]